MVAQGFDSSAGHSPHTHTTGKAQTMSEYKVTYSSVAEAANVAEIYVKNGEHSHATDGDFQAKSRKWLGVSSWSEVADMAVNGWHAETDVALDIAESAIDAVSQEHDMIAFRPVWDVAGCEVDVARYLAGEPENMIDYEITSTPRSGRVIILCASVTYSGSISADTIKRRGQAITALAMALTRLGFACELWVDMSTKIKNYAARTRVLVKGANDEIDPARIMFAYSHPSMLRAIGFGVWHNIPATHKKKLNIGSTYGRVANPAHDLPEGTLYLPGVESDRDVPDADVALLGYMRELGIITD